MTKRLDIVALGDIADMFGVSKQAAFKWADTQHDFPEPAAELSVGRVWYRNDIVRWHKVFAKRKRPATVTKGLVSVNAKRTRKAAPKKGGRK